MRREIVAWSECFVSIIVVSFLGTRLVYGKSITIQLRTTFNYGNGPWRIEMRRRSKELFIFWVILWMKCDDEGFGFPIFWSTLWKWNLQSTIIFLVEAWIRLKLIEKPRQMVKRAMTIWLIDIINIIFSSTRLMFILRFTLNIIHFIAFQ